MMIKPEEYEYEEFAMESTNSPINLSRKAHALRPVRFFSSKEEARYYNAVTFPNGARKGCELSLVRCELFGKFDKNSDFLIDVLDANGDIIQDFGITKSGFEYLQRVLKFMVAS